MKSQYRYPVWMQCRGIPVLLHCNFLNKLDVLLPLADTRFLQRRQTAMSSCFAFPSPSASKPKYDQTIDLEPAFDTSPSLTPLSLLDAISLSTLLHVRTAHNGTCALDSECNTGNSKIPVLPERAYRDTGMGKIPQVTKNTGIPPSTTNIHYE